MTAYIKEIRGGGVKTGVICMANGTTIQSHQLPDFDDLAGLYSCGMISSSHMLTVENLPSSTTSEIWLATSIQT
jgi:hypothetical protein